MRPTMARLTLARKIVTITLTIWKKGVEFRPPTVASASSLSLSGEEGFPSRDFLGWWSLRFRRARFEGEYQSMRLAACASAPSHPLHAMPPRRTRNSHRPRASDRTMVDLKHQFGLPLFRTRWHRHHLLRKLMSMGNSPNLSRETNSSGLDLEKESRLRSRRNFFLDIPFYRTH